MFTFLFKNKSEHFLGSFLFSRSNKNVKKVNLMYIFLQLMYTVTAGNCYKTIPDEKEIHINVLFFIGLDWKYSALPKYEQRWEDYSLLTTFSFLFPVILVLLFFVCLFLLLFFLNKSDWINISAHSVLTKKRKYFQI